MNMQIAMLSALDTLRGDFDAASFRVLMHWHRVGAWICDRFQGTRGVAPSLNGAGHALNEHASNASRQCLTDSQYQALRKFVFAMADASQWMTGHHLDEAENSSRTRFKREFSRLYLEKPEWMHDAMSAVMRGASLPAAAERYAKRAAEIRAACIELAMIGHAVLDDSTTPPPETIPAARALWPRINAAFEQMDAAAIAAFTKMGKGNDANAISEFERACTVVA